MSVARTSSGMLTIVRIAFRREGGRGSAQRGRSVIYDCFVQYRIDNLYSPEYKTGSKLAKKRKENLN